MQPLVEALACHDDLVPFRHKERAEDIDAAIEAVLTADERLREHDDARRVLLEARAEAIRSALDKGATLAELGEKFGLTASRVRQMSLAQS